MVTDSEQDLLLSLAASPDFRNDKLAFAGRRSGLYRSRNKGKSWQLCRLIPGESFSTTALAFSPDFIDDQTVFAALPGGVAYSQDAGDSWSWTRLPAPPPYVSALAVSPHFGSDTTLFAATLEDGVLRSADGGTSWQSWNFGLLDKQVLCLAIPSGDGGIYAGTSTGLFCSLNVGRSWREVRLPVEDCVLSLAISGEHILAGTERHGLFASVDKGESWSRINGGGIEGPINGIQSLAPGDEVLRVLAGNKLMQSVDGAKTWRQIKISALDTPLMLAASLVGFSSGRVMSY